MEEFGNFGITDQYFETNTIASSGADAKEEELKLGPERKRRGKREKRIAYFCLPCWV